MLYISGTTYFMLTLLFVCFITNEYAILCSANEVFEPYNVVVKQIKLWLKMHLQILLQWKSRAEIRQDTRWTQVSLLHNIVV